MLRGLALTLALALATPARAADEVNPYSRGTAKKVVGIVLIPVSAVTFLYYALFAAVASAADCSGAQRTGDCSKAEKKRQQRTTNGALVGALGIGGGIGLIIWGGKDRREWQQWEDEHKAKEAPVRAETGASLRLSLAPVPGGAAGALTLSL
jgi:hypothetical protein